MLELHDRKKKEKKKKKKNINKAYKKEKEEKQRESFFLMALFIKVYNKVCWECNGGTNQLLRERNMMRVLVACHSNVMDINFLR